MHVFRPVNAEAGKPSTLSPRSTICNAQGRIITFLPWQAVSSSSVVSSGVTGGAVAVIRPVAGTSAKASWGGVRDGAHPLHALLCHLSLGRSRAEGGVWVTLVVVT